MLGVWEDGWALAQRVEAPTWALIVTIYGGWLALTAYWHAVPAPLLLLAGAWLCAWHMSLQHELMHGHPTRHVALNTALGWPPLSLWLPYEAYRDSHLRHHRAAHLTDPLEDPESTYVSAAVWARLGRGGRALHNACNTLLGRMLIGPARTMWRFWRGQLARLRTRRVRRIWAAHAVGVVLVLAWVCGVCRISFLSYLAFFVYPGTALTMVRSLAEHRAAPRPEDRTAVVEQAGLLGLLFLNNNLHLLHHECPALPWYRLPQLWRAQRRELLAARSGPVYRGYGEVARRFGLRPQHNGPHPL